MLDKAKILPQYSASSLEAFSDEVGDNLAVKIAEVTQTQALSWILPPALSLG